MIGKATHWFDVALLAVTVCGTAIAAVETSIPFANHGGIQDWRADGSRGIWIRAQGGRWFYASFSSQCTSLPLSVGVRFVPEPGGELSRWSSIRLPHDERCFFRTLQSSDAPPKPHAKRPDEATARG